MTNKRNFFSVKPFLLISSLTLSTSIFSYTSSADSLIQVYQLAKQNDHTYQRALASFNSNKEAINIGRSALLPQVSFNAGYTDTSSDTSSPNPELNGESDSDSTSYSVQLQQSLINFSAINNYQKSKLDSAAAEIQLAADQQNLIIRSAQAYFTVLSAIDQYRTSQAEEKALETQLDQTRQRYEVGLISINDVYETQAAYDSSVANKLSAQVEVGIALDALTTLTGKQHDSIAPLIDNFNAVSPTPNDKGSWVTAADKNNLSLQVRKLNADAANYSKKAAVSNRLPELSGSVSHGNTDTKQTGRDTDSDTTRYSIDLTIPLFTGGNLSALQRQAAQNYLAAQQDFLLAQRTTTQNARRFFLRVSTNIAQIKARKQAIVSNESALEATRAGYDAGTRDIVDVVNAQRNLFQAQRDYYTAQYNYILDTLSLKEVAGSLTVSDLESLEKSLKDSQKVIY